MMAAGQSGLQTLTGLIQTGVGLFGGKKARRELERLPTPTYSPVKSITDYYNEAQKRYQESPYQSNLYKMQAQNIARGTTQGLSSLQDRRSAMAGIPALIQGQNDALLKAGVAAEQQREQRFGQLGSATNAMAAEERKAWDVNQMLPYQRKHALLSQKASGYAQLLNAGMQNISGGAQSGSMLASMRGGGNTYGVNDVSYSDYEYGNLQPNTRGIKTASYQ